MIEFYKDLRQYQAHGTVNIYPILFILIAIQIPYSLLNLHVSKHYFIGSECIAIMFY